MTKSFDKIFTPKFWSLKRASLVVGFVFAMIGTIGQYVLVDGLKKESEAADKRIRQMTEAIATLQNSYFAYHVAAQQGALMFVLDPSGTSHNRELLRNLYKANLLDRATPFRFILGSLATAKEIDYTKTYADYVALNDKARAVFSIENYQAVNNFEGELIQKANERSYALIHERPRKADERAAMENEIDRRRLLLLIIAAIGSIIMLASNVMTAK